jgi:hypothetical protein
MDNFSTQNQDLQTFCALQKPTEKNNKKMDLNMSQKDIPWENVGEE